jgi:hypothetical protein
MLDLASKANDSKERKHHRQEDREIGRCGSGLDEFAFRFSSICLGVPTPCLSVLRSCLRFTQLCFSFDQLGCRLAVIRRLVPAASIFR